MTEVSAPMPELPQAESTHLEVTLLNCLQRLEMLEQCTGVLVQTAQLQVNRVQEQQQLLLGMGDQLAATQQVVESLGDRLPRQPQISALELQPLAHQLNQVEARLQTQRVIGNWVGLGLLVGWGSLALYAGLGLHPLQIATQSALARQQTLLNHLLVCTIQPDAKRCQDLRRAIARQVATD